MANVIVAIHNALLGGNENALAEIQNELSVNGVNNDTVFNAVSKHAAGISLNELSDKMVFNNHLRYYSLSGYSTSELVKTFAVILDAKNIKRIANSLDEFCALELFKAYQFILFADDKVEDKAFSVNSVISDRTVYQLSMKEVYELLLQLNQNNKPIKQFNSNLYWEII